MPDPNPRYREIEEKMKEGLGYRVRLDAILRSSISREVAADLSTYRESQTGRPDADVLTLLNKEQAFNPLFGQTDACADFSVPERRLDHSLCEKLPKCAGPALTRQAQ